MPENPDIHLTIEALRSMVRFSFSDDGSKLGFDLEGKEAQKLAMHILRHAKQALKYKKEDK